MNNKEDHTEAEAADMAVEDAAAVTAAETEAIEETEIVAVAAVTGKDTKLPVVEKQQFFFAFLYPYRTVVSKLTSFKNPSC
jgi:hypothetical protein